MRSRMFRQTQDAAVRVRELGRDRTRRYPEQKSATWALTGASTRHRAALTIKAKDTGHLEFMDTLSGAGQTEGQAGRRDIDAFEVMMTRADRTKGFFVSFAYIF